MSASDKSTYLDAIKEWKTARDLLVASSQRYLDVCLALEALCLDQFGVSSYAPVALQVIHDLDNELGCLQPVRRKLDAAQVVMNTTRNQSPKLVPINILPREILAHIFHLMVITESYVFAIPRDEGENDDTDSNPTKDAIKFTDLNYTISSVCVGWRRLVYDTPVLWSHIDLVVSGSYKQKFYARASYFVKHAAGAPLHICIHRPIKLTTTQDVEDLSDWLAPVFGQIYSLDVSEGVLALGMLRSVIECWFKHGSPNTMKELSFQSSRGLQTQFIEPAGASQLGPWQFNLSPQQLEEFVQHITTLRLEGVLFHWDSQVYSRLLHLRLETGLITERQLRQLLSNNPRLRTLAFSLNVTEAEPREVQQTPVDLQNLTILNLNLMDIARVWVVLRMISPGPHPLRMVLGSEVKRGFDEFVQTKETKVFLQRSYVTRLYLTGNAHNLSVPFDTWLLDSMGSLSHLRALCLQSYACFNENIPFDPSSSQGDTKILNLRELTLIQCELDLDALERLLHTRSIQSLRLWDCSVVYDDSEVFTSMSELEARLSQLISDVKCYEHTPTHLDLCNNWGFSDF